jgi:hypothetical protein
MATAPAYASTPVLWSGAVSNSSADTSFTTPAHGVTLGTGGTNGTKITQIDVIPTGTVVAGLTNVFAYDGTNYHLVLSVVIAAYSSSTTAAPTEQSFYFDNLVLPSNSWTLYATNTIASNPVTVNAYGASL